MTSLQQILSSKKSKQSEDIILVDNYDLFIENNKQETLNKDEFYTSSPYLTRDGVEYYTWERYPERNKNCYMFFWKYFLTSKSSFTRDDRKKCIHYFCEGIILNTFVKASKESIDNCMRRILQRRKINCLEELSQITQLLWQVEQEVPQEILEIILQNMEKEEKENE